MRELAAVAASRSRSFAEELLDHWQWLRNVVRAFQEADQAELVGYGAWAEMIRAMVEDGQDTISLIPDWARLRSRPPWISPEDWMTLSPDRRREIIDGHLEAYLAQQERIERLRTPPWQRDAGWLWRITGVDPNLMGRLDAASLEDMLAYEEYLDGVRAEWQGYWNDFLASQSLYRFGVGDDLTESFLIYMYGLEGAGEYGVGTIVSEEARLLSSEPFRHSYGEVAQYLTLKGDLGPPEFWGKGYGSDRQLDRGVHYNLCGQLAVAVTIGVDPLEGLIAFEGVEGGPEILQNDAAGTDWDDVSGLLSEYGWEGERVGNAGDSYPWRDERGWQPKPDQVASHLDEGRGIIALVNLDTGTGTVAPPDSAGDATHWVSILQVVETQQGEAVIRVYNPFMNREEWYSFDRFVASWAPGPNYRAVLATAPDELQWLPSP